MLTIFFLQRPLNPFDRVGIAVQQVMNSKTTWCGFHPRQKEGRIHGERFTGCGNLLRQIRANKMGLLARVRCGSQEYSLPGPRAQRGSVCLATFGQLAWP
jgi:hypothetical protein